MDFSPQFYRCETCGQIIGVVDNRGVRLSCCGTPMALLTPNTADAAGEKHLPIAVLQDDELVVKIGSIAHPSTPEHYIQWVYLFLDNGGQRRILTSGDAPEVIFDVAHGKPRAVFAYCSLHGLWKTHL